MGITLSRDGQIDSVLVSSHSRVEDLGGAEGWNTMFTISQRLYMASTQSTAITCRPTMYYNCKDEK